MRRPNALAVLAAAAVVVAAGYAFAAFARDDDPRPTVPDAPRSGAAVAPLAPPVAAPDAAPGTQSELDRVIGVFERRVKERDDATDLAFLGRLYLIRARRTNDLGSYDQALAALERAVDVAPRYEDALTLLASTRYALHDFAAAAALAEELLAADPANLEARLVAGDAALAVGDITAARAAFEELAETLPGAPPIDSRRAQVAWLEGDVPRAVALAASAEEQAARSGARDVDLAWYRSFRGALAFDQGRIDVAATRYEQALEAFPGYPVALGGLAAVRAAEGRHADAINLYLEATAAVPDPEFLAALGDLYLVTGDPEAAEDQYATVEVIGRLGAAGGAVYNRVLALFWADHDRNVEEALRLTTAELELRRDVYGWDAHAWALYRNGRFDAAREASDEALALGTQDAELWYHAGLISAALGDSGRAARELRRALEINPEFDPIHAPAARTALAEVEGS